MQTSQDFSIRNTGTQPLTVEQFSFSALGNFLKSPQASSFPIVEPDTRRRTLTVDVPSTAVAADYEGFAQLQVGSTAINANEGNISVQVSAGAGSAPAIDLSASSLVFTDAATKNLTIENIGEATFK
ncbi:MAG: hypothetical protein R3E66_15445 [bacterium]